jgi:hypothetical protein
MPATPQWNGAQAWQGQLGPDLLPLSGPDIAPMASYQSTSGVVPLPGQGRADGQRDEVWAGMQILPMPGMQSLPQMNGAQVQMIALPAGAAPPPGAIPVGPQQVHEPPPAPSMVKMIAVPLGQAPPEGAVAVDQYPVPLSSLDTNLVEPMSADPPLKTSKAFKITDPRTGRELGASEEDNAVAPRPRLRITNPKTGEEVFPATVFGDF